MATQTIYLGTTERIWREYRDLNDATVDPSGPKVFVYNPLGTLCASATPTKYLTGIYYYDFTVGSTATPGLYTAWWSGTIGSSMVNMDEPQYIQVIYRPWDLADTTGMIRRVRMSIGDNDPDNYKYQPHDIAYYILFAMNDINSRYSLGVTAYLDSMGKLVFSSTPSALANTLYSMQAVYLILSSELSYVLSDVGSFDVGDVSVNIAGGGSIKREHVSQLKKDIDSILEAAIYQGAESAGSLVDTYYNIGKPYLTGWRTD